MQRKWFRARTRVLALVVVAAMGLTACGGADSSTGSKEELDVTTGDLTGDPIKLGTLCSCTGPLGASIGQSLEVLKAWGSWTNSNGGINGHPVEIVAYDDGQNPTTALAQAKKLVEEEKVMAIVGTMSLVTDSWAGYVTKKNIPVVGGQPVDTAFFTNPNFFASGTTLPLQLLAVVSLAKEHGAKKLGLYYCSETPVCAQLPAIVEPMAAQLGLTVEAAKVSQTAPNYIAPCLAFKEKSVDAVFSVVNSDAVPRLADSCAKQGFKPLQIAVSGTTQKSWTDDPNLDGSVIAGANAVYTDESVPGVKDFLDGLEEYAPEVPASPQFAYPLFYPWVGGQLFAAAAKAAKLTPTSTGQDVIKGLRMLKDETLDGIAPPLNFPKGRPGFPLCYFPSSIADGQFEPDAPRVCIDQATADGMLEALAG